MSPLFIFTGKSKFQKGSTYSTSQGIERLQCFLLPVENDVIIAYWCCDCWNDLVIHSLTYNHMQTATQKLTSITWGELLKKLWCCVGGRVQQGYLVLLTELIV